MSVHTPPSEDVFTKAFRYRLYPTTEQQRYLAKVFGCCRYVYNRLLAEHRIALRDLRGEPERTFLNVKL